jgi:hypothetical protein
MMAMMKNMSNACKISRLRKISPHAIMTGPIVFTNNAIDDLNSEFFESSICELSGSKISDDEVSDDENRWGHPEFILRS